MISKEKNWFSSIPKLVLAIFGLEFISFISFLIPDIGIALFFLIISAFFCVAFYKLEYGSYIILAELFIGSKGYLMSFDFGGIKISIRIAFWIIIISIWTAKMILMLIRKQKISKFLKIPNRYPFFILFLFIALGGLSGLINNNSLSNIFFDMNNWLFFSLLFPFWYAFDKLEIFDNIRNVFVASTVWLGLKTMTLLFVFSHWTNEIAAIIYKWVRDTGIGEITLVDRGFYRIFIQSHIFILIGFLAGLFYTAFYLSTKDRNLKILINRLLYSSLMLTVILISFSRSYWVGLGVGSLMFIFLSFYFLKYTFKKFIFLTILLSQILITAIFLIIAIIKFPYPVSKGIFSADLLTERASQINNEAGVSSRWSQLKPLWATIAESPILGKGYGSTVTYKSSDPRIVSSHPDGSYTTYAFEWGWLDIWLKIGLLGMVAYVYLLAKILYDNLKLSGIINKNEGVDSQKLNAIILSVSLIMIVFVSSFSPYLNHPLGIGFLLISAIFPFYSVVRE
jgi:O-antigen ligase